MILCERREPQRKAGEIDGPRVFVDPVEAPLCDQASVIHSTNQLERLNGEIKRRTEILGIFQRASHYPLGWCHSPAPAAVPSPCTSDPMYRHHAEANLSLSPSPDSGGDRMAKPGSWVGRHYPDIGLFESSRRTQNIIHQLDRMRMKTLFLGAFAVHVAPQIIGK